MLTKKAPILIHDVCMYVCMYFLVPFCLALGVNHGCFFLFTYFEMGPRFPHIWFLAGTTILFQAWFTMSRQPCHPSMNRWMDTIFAFKDFKMCSLQLKKNMKNIKYFGELLFGQVAAHPCSQLSWDPISSFFCV